MIYKGSWKSYFVLNYKLVLLQKSFDMLKHLQTYFNNLPGYLIFYVTNRCNFRCKFCYYSEEIQKGRKVNELTIDEIEKISNNCKNIIQISMAGGEPFLRKDFNEITKIFVKNSNVKYINIPTNGSLTSRMVEYLEEILPICSETSFRLTFSIDGIGKSEKFSKIVLLIDELFA